MLRRSRTITLIALAVVVATTGATALVPSAVPDLPVLGDPVPKAPGLKTAPAAPIPPASKTIDGDVTDWIGAISRFGGTAITSAGELVYQDYLMDDWGADDGEKADLLATFATLRDVESRTYRAESLSQALDEQFGVDGPLSSKINYGDAEFPEGRGDCADLEEARVAADTTRLLFLVRTAGMTDACRTAVLLLIDTEAGGRYAAPGGVRTGAEWAFLAAGTRVVQASFKGDNIAAPFEVATNSADYTNAIEIGVPRSLLGAGAPKVALATALLDESGTGVEKIARGDGKADLVNVAFRFDEPTRIWMDSEQAEALRAGSIDRYLVPVDLAKLLGGYTETFQPQNGYWERIYVSDSPVNREVTDDSYFQGAFQHYGVYLPSTYRPGRAAPATWWTHYRGGHAHDAAAWVPGLMRHLGEQQGNIVISPGARGTSSWYVGRGHEDFLETWDDSMATFSIDPDRVYISGYSMGGFASWLLGMLYPDRWAGAFPTSGPPTQGLWAGVGEASGSQNEGDAQAQLTFHIIENARNVPYVIYHGTNDELVPSPGVARMASRFTELGYRNRLYLFPGYEHYTHAIVDEWVAAAQYLNGFRRDPNPAHVTYRVWPAIERAVETVSVPEGAVLDYTFDGAYWVDGLTVRGNTKDISTMGTIDAVSYALGLPTVISVPEAGIVALGQTTPFVMTGLNWLETGREPTRNAFALGLDHIATASLDVARMALKTNRPIVGTVTSDGPALLRLVGTWAAAPQVTGATSSSYAAGVLTIEIPAGTRTIRITP